MVEGPLAGTHLSYHPSPHAAVVPVQEWSNAPRYWISEAGRPANSAAARRENGSTVSPLLLACSKTDLPLGRRSADLSAKPRTPRREPKKWSKDRFSCMSTMTCLIALRPPG